MVIVMLMSGYMLDKYIVGYEKYFLLCGTLCVFFFIFKTMEASTVTQAIVYLSLTFAAMAVIISTVYVLPLKYLPKQMIGSATGFINFMQQLAGCISSAVMGFLITHHADSYSPIFAFVMVMILLSIVATLMINPNDLGEEGAPKIKNDY
jgi:MFS family permease